MMASPQIWLVFIAYAASSLGLWAQNVSAEEQFLTQLHEGALLVRLQDRTQSIQKLEERGYPDRAAELREQQYLENKETILSFKNTFTFAPVFFFYAKDSEKVRNQQLEGVLFKADQTPVLSQEIPKTFYTAEFSETSQLGITGLIIMDHKLIPLKAPLPHFERKFILLGLISRSKAEMAKAYNQELWEKYRFHFPDR